MRDIESMLTSKQLVLRLVVDLSDSRSLCWTLDLLHHLTRDWALIDV
jgi:hypothetical protein